MRLRSTIFPLITIIHLLVSCSQNASLEADCPEFYEAQHLAREINIAVGEEFSMTLCSNPTTGFQWSEEAEISAPGVVEQLDHVFIGPADDPSPPGTPGSEVWTFRALSQGDCTISFAYSRPWEGGEKSEWTFVLSVAAE